MLGEAGKWREERKKEREKREGWKRQIANFAPGGGQLLSWVDTFLPLKLLFKEKCLPSWVRPDLVKI